MSLDSSILISHLAGDVHQESVLAAMEHLDAMGTELTLPLLCYAEVWTGVEHLDDAERRQQTAEVLQNILQASCILLVADNVAIAREAARAQAAYRRRGGRREVLIPDFLIGANAAHYAGRLLTTNLRDFFRTFPPLEVLTPEAFLEQYRPAQ
jgi:predicted nucleic acid-binding protein